MKKKNLISKLLLCSIFTLAMAPTAVRAASSLLSFDGTGISGGIYTNGTFYNDDGIFRVSGTVAYEGNSEGPQFEKLGLTIDAAKKSWLGFSRQKVNYYVKNDYNLKFDVPVGEYKMFFQSGNYNFWATKGNVYDD